MLKTRLIPILLLKNGQLVRSEDFLTHQIIGDPIHEVKRFNEWNVDELIYIDITQGDYNFQRRSDHKTKGLENPLSILDEVSKTCFVPLTWGGRIRCFDDAAERFQHGADKITLNRALFDTPDLVKKSPEDMVPKPSLQAWMSFSIPLENMKYSQTETALPKEKIRPNGQNNWKPWALEKFWCRPSIKTGKEQDMICP